MKFIALCACERVIVDKIGAHSLINIMQNVQVQGVPKGPSQTLLPTPAVPTNTVLSNLWFIFSMWKPSAEDIGKTFEQVHQVFWPDGTKFNEGKLQFKPDENMQQNSYGLVGFPVGQPGPLRIVTWVEDNGKRITDVLDYEIRVKHDPAINPVTAPTK